MIHQRHKDALFGIISKLTLVNHVYRKYVAPVPHRNGRGLHLHLGCGNEYLPGFVNVDANPREHIDLWIDVRNGLPFKTGSVDSIYTSQMIEHLFPDELDRFLAECYRVLKFGGGLRILVPNLKSAIVAYSQDRHDFFSDWPRSYRSLGGRFSNWIFCDGQHRVGLDFSYLSELLHKAGFRDIAESVAGESRIYTGLPLAPPEHDDAALPRFLYAEAVKERARLTLSEAA